MDSLIKFFTKSPWGKSLLLLIGWDLVLRLTAVAGYFILRERYSPLSFLSTFAQSNFLLWSFANFDGEHYLSIARFGYQLRDGFPQYAFFPLFPILIRLLATIIGDYYWAGMLVSQGALWIGLTYLSKWCHELKLPDLRLPLLLSTGAIFLASIYTEPVFLALTAMTLYFSERKWWIRSALVTALATATRVNGVFLALFILVKIYQSSKSPLKALAHFLLGLTGIIAYMFFLYQKTGDALAWFHAQAAWGKAVATSPLTTIVSYLRSITIGFQPDLTHLVVVIEVLTTLTALTLFVRLLLTHQLGLSYWLYLGFNLALPLATGSLGSMPRFFLTLFPLLIVVPGLPKLGRTLYYIFSLSACLIGVILFTRGYWYG